MTQEEINFRKPQLADGIAIYQLIDRNPPLDVNSAYSYYLLADHFSDCCVVAEDGSGICAFLSAYPIPRESDTLFVWQIAVDERVRGQALGYRMLEHLLQRPELAGVRRVCATVGPDNMASRRIFEKLAVSRHCELSERLWLDEAAFGEGNVHDAEILLTIPVKKEIQ